MGTRPQNAQRNVGPFTASQLYESIPIPAGSRCIRVLDLRADPTVTDGSLVGTLPRVDLQQSPKFTALSYVWGSGRTNTISCNGSNVPITASAHEALSSLRDTLGAVTIWIDTVCINQDNDAEKATQIPLMEEIYTWAQAVYIWLGPGSRATNEAMGYIRALSTIRLVPAGVPWLDGDGTCTVFRDKTRLVLKAMAIAFGRHLYDRSTPRSCAAEPILELLDTTWLNRAWTFQEIALASNPIIVCGRDHVPWLDWNQALISIDDLRGDGKVTRSTPFRNWRYLFIVWMEITRPCCWNGRRFRTLPNSDESSVSEYLRVLQPKTIQSRTVLFSALLVLFSGILVSSLTLKLVFIPPLRHSAVAKALLVPVAAVLLMGAFVFSCLILSDGTRGFFFRYRAGWVQTPNEVGQRNQLVGLLRAMREHDSTESRDRVFAFGGVYRRLGIEQPIPNYDKPVRHVHRDAFAGLVTMEPSFINLLIDCGIGHPGAPSWVSDWTLSGRSWLSSSFIYDSILDWPESSTELGISVAGNTLSVSATILRTATHCTPPFKGKSDLKPVAETSASLLHNLQALFQWVQVIRGDCLVNMLHESIPRAIFNTLDACCASSPGIHGEEHPVLDGESFMQLWRLMKEHRVQFEKEMGTTVKILPTVEAMANKMADKEGCLRFLIRIGNCLAGNRSLFVSDDGVLGAGPEIMVEGDVISIIKGVAVPIVLHRLGPDGQKYTVRGPAYVDGLMDLHRKDVEESYRWERVKLL